MGASTSITVRFERDRLGISLARLATNGVDRQVLDYYYNTVQVRRRTITPDIFVEEYIKLVNTLLADYPLTTIQSNLQPYVLHFVNNLGSVGDVITINDIEYEHIRSGIKLVTMRTDQIAVRSRMKANYFQRSSVLDSLFLLDYLATI